MGGGVVLGGLAAVVLGVGRMAMRGMRVVGRFLVRARLGVLGGFTMVLGGTLVMGCGLGMVLGVGLSGHWSVSSSC